MTKFTNFDLDGASMEITDTFIWNNSHKEPYILARRPGEFRFIDNFICCVGKS